MTWLALCILMNSTIQFDTINFGWLIVHIKGSQVRISKQDEFQSLKIVFILVNSADLDEMLHYAAFHPGLHYLPKYPFTGFQYTKVSIEYSKTCLKQPLKKKTTNRFLRPIIV